MAQNSPKQSWQQAILRRYAQPRQTDLVVLRGQRSVTVYGCRRILQYSPERIRLQSGKRVVALEGRDMICTAFSGGSASVKGRIRGVFFLGAEDRKEEKDADV